MNIRQLEEICDNKPMWKTHCFYMHISKVFIKLVGTKTFVFPQVTEFTRSPKQFRAEQGRRGVQLLSGSRSSSLGIKAQLFPVGPAPPGEGGGWPESCRQSEVINPAGIPSHAVLVRHSGEGRGPWVQSVFPVLSGLLDREITVEDHFPFLHWWKTPPIALTHHPTPSKHPRWCFAPLCCLHGLTTSCPAPQTRLWGEFTAQEEGDGQDHEHFFSQVPH